MFGLLQVQIPHLESVEMMRKLRVSSLGAGSMNALKMSSVFDRDIRDSRCYILYMMTSDHLVNIYI